MSVTKTPGRFPWAEGLLLCLFLTLVSLLGRPFIYGVDNNVFHIPIVQHAYDWPQFRQDSFYQSLRGYTSSVWLVLGLLGPRAATPEAFLLIHAAIRFLTFLSLYGLARALEVPRAVSALALIIFTASPLAYGSSRVGMQDLLDDSLTHTSLIWPLIFASLTLLVRGRPVLAIGLNGALFCFNAFVAVWHGVALLVASLTSARLSTPPQGPGSFVRSWIVGLGLALVLASPVLVWILRSTSIAEPSFDYAAYLRSYWPYHFFITASAPKDLAALVATLLMSLVALVRLREGRRVLLAAWLGYLGLFAFGVVLPEISHSRTLLNLHLLRIDGVLQILGLLGASLVVARGVLAQDAPVRRLAALGAGVFLVLGGKFVVATLVILTCLLILDRRQRLDGAEARTPASRGVGPGLVSGRGALVVGLSGLLLVGQASLLRMEAARDPRLASLELERQLADFIRIHTQTQALVLSLPSARPPPDIELSELQLGAQRRLWVDWKRGAAVMWRTDYFHEWRGRMDEVAGLQSAAEVEAYACAHGITHLVENRARLAPGYRARLVYANARYVVLDLADVCAPGVHARLLGGTAAEVR